MDKITIMLTEAEKANLIAFLDRVSVTGINEVSAMSNILTKLLNPPIDNIE